MLGTVLTLYRYPVKALRAEQLTTVEVDADGIPGDRGRALFVTSPDHARTGKTYRGKENRRLHLTTEIEEATTFAENAGITVRTEDAQPHYYDAEPVSIVFDTWLRDLESLAGRTVDALRFRPNIVAQASPSFTYTEHDLVGKRITIGSASFNVVSPITRCVTPSYDVQTGDPDPALQKTIVIQRGNIMGIYCRVVTPGTIQTGSEIATP